MHTAIMVGAIAASLAAACSNSTSPPNLCAGRDAAATVTATDSMTVAGSFGYHCNLYSSMGATIVVN